MPSNTILFLDFESCSKYKNTTQPTQLAAIAIDMRTMEIIPDSEFCSFMKPEFDEEKCKKMGVDTVSDEALKITGITIEQLEKAPDPKTVWNDFVNYVNRFNAGKGQWDAPIMAGYNIENFDKVIINRLAGHKPYNYGPFDKTFQECTLFNPIKTYDVMKDIQRWMEPNKNIRSISMDSMREYFGMSKDGAHNALVDVKQGAEILVKFLKLYRFLSPKIKFKDCFKNHPEFGG